MIYGWIIVAAARGGTPRPRWSLRVRPELSLDIPGLVRTLNASGHPTRAATSGNSAGRVRQNQVTRVTTGPGLPFGMEVFVA
jgi:hypothetical protein